LAIADTNTDVPTIGKLSEADLRLTASMIPTVAENLPDIGCDSLSEYPITGGVDIAATTRALAEGQGAILMSSGGTTGAPKLSWLPHDLGLRQQCRTWDPLDASSVLLNLFNPGRLWGSHYYMQELARISCSVVLPAGPFDKSEIPNWVEVFQRAEVNALAGNPTTLADFADACLEHGVDLPINKIIWMAEPWATRKLNSIAAAFPKASLWGNYGAVETWVMGTSKPECTPNVLHLLPGHMMECYDNGALISRRADGWAVPLLRYNLKDRVVPAHCACGGERAMRVLGRVEDTVSLRSAIFRADEVLDIVREVPDVVDAQIVLSSEKETSASVMTIDFIADGATDDIDHVNLTVRDRLVAGFVHMASIVAKYPDALRVECVDSLIRIGRTNKTPAVVRR
jgi:hypothetical protein